MMVEACTDIASHIISDRGYRIPTTYADTFRVLFEKGILTGDVMNTMEKMAKFRNIVVHHYDKIDGEIIIGILRRNLDEFIQFRDAILKELDEERNLCEAK